MFFFLLRVWPSEGLYANSKSKTDSVERGQYKGYDATTYLYIFVYEVPDEQIPWPHVYNEKCCNTKGPNADEFG